MWFRCRTCEFKMWRGNRLVLEQGRAELVVAINLLFNAWLRLHEAVFTPANNWRRNPLMFGPDFFYFFYEVYCS